MTIAKMDINDFKRSYIISNEISDALDVLSWLESANIPELAKMDFVSRAALHNTNAVALTIAQSFTTPGKILLINMERDSSATNGFITKLEEYQAAEMEYTHLVLQGTSLVDYKTNQPVELTNVLEGKKELNDTTINLGLDGVVKNWEGAKELMRVGRSVRRLSMPAHAFIGFNGGKVIEADKFWVDANKQAAINNGGTMRVEPYFTYCDGESVQMGWMPAMKDEFGEWVDADMQLTLADLTLLHNGKFEAHYMLQPGGFCAGTKLFTLNQMFAKPGITETYFYTGDNSSTLCLMSLVADMKHNIINEEGKVHSVSYMQDGILNNYNPNSMSMVMEEVLFKDEAKCWDTERLLNDILTTLESSPDSWHIIDLRGLSNSSDAIGKLGAEEANEVAVKAINFLRHKLPQGGNWFIVDMDYEVADV